MSNCIQAFWDIVRQHHKLFSVPDNDKDDQMMTALRSLQQIDSRLYFHCGYRDDGMDFLLSAEGHYDLGDVVVAIVDAAPALADWRVRPILESRALFGERDFDLFPDDENGDILYGIAQRAGDLIRPADVDFCHVFPSEQEVQLFALALEAAFEREAEPYDGRDGYSWQVIAVRRMIPSHSHITSTERALADLAATYSGSPDGWGFMSS
jgi:hypothetical protein